MLPDATFPYTSQNEIVFLISQQAIDLRTDDAAADGTTEAELINFAIDYANAEVDQACQQRYLPSDLQNVPWIRNVATFLASEWFCMRRANSVPATLTKTCDRYREQLNMIAEGRRIVANCPRSRRPLTVTNQVIDLRRFNNNPRTDKTRSTGVAKGYIEPVDPTAPDNR